VLRDWSLSSSVASSSAGIELMHNVVIVMGNSAGSASPFVIGHAVMRDAIDLSAVLRALESVGLGPADGAMNSRLINIFAKAEASPDGAVRGFRHTMLDDTDISSTRHARAAVGGLIGGVAGSGAVYVSGGAEHQGPPGGGPVAVIARACRRRASASNSTSGRCALWLRRGADRLRVPLVSQADAAFGERLSTAAFGAPSFGAAPNRCFPLLSGGVSPGILHLALSGKQANHAHAQTNLAQRSRPHPLVLRCKCGARRARAQCAGCRLGRAGDRGSVRRKR
jgi:hypothetical protein